MPQRNLFTVAPKVLQQLGTLRLRGLLLREVMAETSNSSSIRHVSDFMHRHRGFDRCQEANRAAIRGF
jgi:hypothetical protein